MKNSTYIFISILLFVISLILPVYWHYSSFIDHYDESDSYELWGGFFLTMGWMTIFESPPDFVCWLANFTLFFSWLLYKKSFSKILSVITFVLMLLYFINYICVADIIQFYQPEDELFGYWIWLVSSICMIIYHFKYKIEKL